MYYHKYLKYKKKYLNASLAADASKKIAYEVSESIKEDAASSKVMATDVSTKSSAEEVAAAEAYKASSKDGKTINELNDCLEIYSNIGGTRGQRAVISLEEASHINSALDNTIQQIKAFKPKFLHLVFGGICHPGDTTLDRRRYSKCLERRFFWPYKIYDSIILDEDGEEDDEEYQLLKATIDNTIDGNVNLPKQAILIIDPIPLQDVSHIPDLNYVDSSELNQKWKNSIQVWHLNKWVFAKNKKCTFNRKILTLLELVKNNGGIISILNDIKAYASPSPPINKYMTPFILYSLQNPKQVLYISWQPNVKAPGIFKEDDLEENGTNNMGIIIKRKSQTNILPSSFTTFKATIDLLKIYQSPYWNNSDQNFGLINLTAPVSWAPEKSILTKSNKRITIYRSGICPYIDKTDSGFVWKTKVLSSNGDGLVFGEELL